MTCCYLLVCAVIVCALFGNGETSPLLRVNDDGGYENIVVAISPKIEKLKWNLMLTQIKEMLQLMSTRLHNVSRSTFYFKKATILVPTGWKYEKRATFEVYKEADIRLEDPNWTLGKDIFTQQPRGCGDSGDFIQINAKVLDDWNNKKNDIANQMVREWSRLRFGIFEEHGHEGSIRFPLTYQGETQDRFLRTTCNQPNPWICRFNSQPPNNVHDQISCELDPTVTSLTSSVMSDTQLPTTTFCDSTENLHNSEAPTKHNALCQERSTWDVIQRSADYQSFNASNSSPPNIEVVVVASDPPNSKVVIVVDPSLCISTKDISSTVKSSISKLIAKDFLEDNLPGIIIADDIPNVIYELGTHGISATKVITKFDGECIATRPESTSRNIQDGLDEAIKMIREKTDDADSLGVVILVANGLKLSDSDFKNLPIKNRKNIRFHVVTYPPKTSKFFDGLEATMNWYNVPYNHHTECDLEARLRFDELFQSILGQYDTQFVLRRRLVFQKLHEGRGSGSIDKKYDGNCFIVLYYCQGFRESRPKLTVDQKQIALEAPVELSYSIAFTDSIAQLKTYDVTDTEEVKSYFMSIWYEATDPQRFNIIGEIDPQTSSLPPLLRAFVSWETATVKAVVTKDTAGTPETIELLKSADKQSGIMTLYERYYLSSNTKEPGYFTVTFNASDSSVTTFNQMTSYSSFQGKGLADKIYPPRRITDFALKNKTETEATFTWTAPGNQLDIGKADAYLLACVSNKDELATSNYQDFNGMIPGIAGKKEERTWLRENPGGLLYCAIKARGSTGIESDRSNIVILYFYATGTSSTSTLSSTTVTSNQNRTDGIGVTENSSDELSTGSIAGIVVGVICIIVIIVVVLLFFFLRQKRRARAEEEDQKNNGSRFQGADVIRTVSSQMNNANSNNETRNGRRASNDSNDSWKPADLYAVTSEPNNKGRYNLPPQENSHNQNTYDTYGSTDYDPQPVGLPLPKHTNTNSAFEDYEDGYATFGNNTKKERPYNGAQNVNNSNGLHGPINSKNASSEDLEIYNKIMKPTQNVNPHFNQPVLTTLPKGFWLDSENSSENQEDPEIYNKVIKPQKMTNTYNTNRDNDLGTAV